MNPMPNVSPIITLTTDFGLSDGFVGVMKGVILGINPHATIVDITHDISPQNIEEGAFLFANAYKYFPPNAIHVVVVDPGVGTARRPIGLKRDDMMFVAPDNGVLTLAIQDSRQEESIGLQVVHLNKPQYWLPRVSSTFHGRDIFSPVAAHLSLGMPLESMGDPITDWVRLSGCESLVRRLGNEIAGRVVHIDRFGNIITNISAELLAGIDYTRILVMVRGRTYTGVKASYSQAAAGGALVLVNSSGYLEIAVREGNAARILGIGVGEEVFVRA